MSMYAHPPNWLTAADVGALAEQTGLVQLPSGESVYCKRGAGLLREFSLLRRLAKANCPTPPSVAFCRTSNGEEVLVTKFVGERLSFEGYHDLTVLKQIFEAFRAIWACGVVHCDVKPEHIRVHDGQVMIIDFDFVFDMLAEIKPPRNTSICTCRTRCIPPSSVAPWRSPRSTR
jgi:serine/threonine protein kinase